MAAAGQRALTDTIKGSVTFITGGRSGLGKGVLEYFLECGSKVVVYDLPESFTGKPVETNNCLNIAGDVTDEIGVSEAMKRCKEKFGRLDNLVNCAGIHKAQAIYLFKHDVPHSQKNLMEMLNVNISGRFNVARQAVGLMKENEPNHNGQRGVIINVAGSAAWDGMSGQAVISACEGAVTSMTLPMSRDLAEVGIRAVTIAPGLMYSNIQKRWTTNTFKLYQMNAEFPKRLGEPKEFAVMCKTVCENPLINGESIRLDGAARFFY